MLCLQVKSRQIIIKFHSNGPFIQIAQQMHYNPFPALLLFLTLLSTSLCIYISNTEPQSVESVITYRKMVKQNNEKYIKASNSKSMGYELQPYPWLVSLTVEEYSMMYTNRVILQEQQVLLATSIEKPSLSADQLYIRRVGMKVVNNSLWTGEVKNQGMCGSCYAFAATALINYVTSSDINTITPMEASEQEIAECSFKYRNKGCEGGWPHQALLFALQMGISSDMSYPYRNQTFYHSQLQNCSAVGWANKEFKLKNYEVRLTTKAPQHRMMNLLDNYGALAIGIISSTRRFMFYQKGVLKNCGDDTSQKMIDHAVTIQGYYSDPQQQTEYWIIKNSWGNTWGESGRVRLSMSNNCKIGQIVAFLAKRN